MESWYDLTFIQKALALAPVAVFVLGVLVNLNAKYNKDSGSTKTNTSQSKGDDTK